MRSRDSPPNPADRRIASSIDLAAPSVQSQTVPGPNFQFGRFFVKAPLQQGLHVSGHIGGLGLFVYIMFVNRPSGRLWFYWIAPLLALGFAGMMIQLVVGYWLKVGRLEARGRRVE